MTGGAVVAHDDLGHSLLLQQAPVRVVSLVPSLTESVAAGADPEILVGATDWCSHPADLEVVRVRGTKNPNVAAIIALRPDLVLANKEENRKHDVEALRAAGISVWVTVIETVDDALSSLRRMFTDALLQPVPEWLEEASRVWGEPAPLVRRSVVIPVWRDPWMVVGSSTFTGDLVSRLGLDNVYSQHPERYPHVELDELRDRSPEVVLLADEPYAFSASDGPEVFDASSVRLMSGRSLTWYGPSLATARGTLLEALQTGSEK